MYALATTTVSILRGTATNEYGDEVDASTPVHTGVLASIIEQTSTVATAENPTPRIIRLITGRVEAGTDVTDQDRILDENTGTIYIVNNVTARQSPAYQADIRLDLRVTT